MPSQFNLRLGKAAGLFFVLVCATPAYPQVSKAENALRVAFTGKSVSEKDGAPERLHWVLDALPGPDDVLVTDSTAKARLIEIIPKLNDRPEHAACHVWVLEKNNQCSFTTAITLQLAAIGTKFEFTAPAVPLIRLPGQATPSASAVLRATYLTNADRVVSSLCLVVTTEPQAEVCSTPDPSSESTTVGALASAHGISGLTPDTQKIQIRIHIPETTPATNGTGEPLTKDRMRQQLQDVAIAAFKVAQSFDLLPGAKNPEARQEKAENQILAIYSIDHSNWPAPKVTYGPVQENSSDYQLTVKNLHFVGSARVVVTQGSVTGVNPGQIEAKLAQAGKQVDHRFRDSLNSLQGAIPTNAGVWKVAHEIAAAPEITGAVLPLANNGDLEFQGDHRWMFSSLDAKGDIGLAVNPHEVISGDTQFSESNLGGFVHTTALTLHAGPELQQSNLDFDITRFLGGHDQFTYGFHLNGTYFRDQNQRFGFLAGPKFIDEEWGPTPKLFFEFIPVSAGGKFSSDTRIDVPLEFRHFGIQAPDSYPPLLNRGWVTAFTPVVRQLVGYDFSRFGPNAVPRGGVGEVIILFTGNAALARPGLGGNFTFDRYQATAQAEVFWGITRTNDFLVRYSRGLGTSTSTTPLFELFRLGGSSNVRGIEEGEFVGRNIVFDQSEFGVNAQSLWQWITRKPKTASAAGPSAAPQLNTLLSGLGITSIFLNGFYDRGRVIDITSLGNLLDLRHSMHGAGFDVELRGLRVKNKRANLSLGYARSPESILHTKGVFISSLSIDF
jgi:hypothetical protein